jgi:hypothetical protein
VTESPAFLPVSISSRRSRSASSATEAICSAIRSCTLLEFEYEGLHRVVAPYCHGFTGKGEALRAIQVRGASHSRGFGFGKLWVVEKMVDVRLGSEPFVPNDPHYNPRDSAMTTIHCAVRAIAEPRE